MIQLLATRYCKHIAYYLFLIFCTSLSPVVYGKSQNYNRIVASKYFTDSGNMSPIAGNRISVNDDVVSNTINNRNDKPVVAGMESEPDEDFIGGPSQPESSSFQSVGTDNMVNLFTGDFNYSIALMDVGGYPLNMFYSGGIGPEQEASWVGLGWNINPGTVSRNMRGLPDDFNGTDTMVQVQTMKPNKTWGVRIGGDLELVGIKDFAAFSGSLGASIGVSVNNYLGPALELGVKGTTGLTIANKSNSEKNASLRVSAGLDANLSSRYGLTLSPNVSLSASSTRANRVSTFGLGLSTSYNSRTGIKGLQLSEQMSFSNTQEKKHHSSQTIPMFSSTISFTKPSYVPTLRMPVTNSAFAGRFQLGTGIFGVYGSLEAEVYLQSAEVKKNDSLQKKPLVGYLYYQKAVNNANAVMDFTRFNDAEVTPNTPIISAPQYSYDVFSIQGEGTGGSIRAYRNDLGYVRDNYTRSQDKSLSVGADIGIPGHYGANFNTVKTPSVIGEWGNGNQLRDLVNFTEAKDTTENVYFRNPGESSVLHPDQFKKIGGTDLVRFQLGGTGYSPTIKPVLEQFSKTNVPIGTTNIITAAQQLSRKKRTQVTSFLTAEEASRVGLNRQIKIYRTDVILDGSNNLLYDSMQRVSDYRKKHHISQVTVTEGDGKQYIYDLPAYNVTQKDFTFTVNNPESGDNMVTTSLNEMNTLNPDSKKDGYLLRTETPAYAHSFLLSGLLSPDYVDVTGDGITEDDLGTAIKFNYTRTKNGAQWLDHPWRTPLTSSGVYANFNEGKKTEKKDDKGIVSYGTRESWYLHSVESKTMIALFTLENRNDGKGPVDQASAVNSSDVSQKRLKKIDLYNKADLKKNGIANAKPIKTAWFSYSYTLCSGTPDNPTGGKLTLDSIYFTFNGKPRQNKNKFAFSYNGGSAGNLNYTYNSSDRWGNFKPSRRNPGGLKNSDYPYSLQDKAIKDSIDYFSSAWSLKKILLPTGGQLEIEYESDDYAFVQNRRAADMLEVAGVGPDSTTITNRLYGVNPLGFVDYDYVFVKVPEPCATKAEVYQKYVQGLNQLAVKLTVLMPDGEESVPSYVTIADWGRYDATRIWIRVNKTDGLSPLSLTALEYLREQLPGQAFSGYDVSESSGLKQVGEMLVGMLDALSGAFKNPVNTLRGQGKARFIVTTKSFVRLNDPDGFKYGGGQRVKSIRLKDNWKTMTKQFTSEYGQQYDYTTKEIFNGVQRTISSGVASYEPTIGSEENPFQSIVQVSNKLPLGPTSYGAVEMPVLDAFFPAPSVGYSKVTVRSIKKGPQDPTKKYRSGIGRQVTEYYTAKDFPVYYNHTALDPLSDKQVHQSSVAAFFYKYAFDSRALSQGFIVETNDMHGKLKSQASYAENDSTTRISYVENFYRNTGSKGMNEKFDFIHQSKGGTVEEGNMGIDVELMTDTREFSVKGSSFEIQGQVDLFPVIFPFWLPFIWPVSGNSENTYRAVTTTKIVNYHAVLDSIVSIDKGSQVSTKNLVYDAETGAIVITRTNNEYDKPVYTVTYPAWWAYSNMSLAYRNIGVLYSGVKFRDGKITTGLTAAEINRIFESGDELYLSYPGDIPPPSDVCANRTASASVWKLWAFDKNKSISSLTNPNPDLVFMDSIGRLYTKDNVSFRIIRSGKRNMLGLPVASVTLMENPVRTVSTVKKMIIDATSKVINATANELREKWQTDNDVIKLTKPYLDPATCTYRDIIDCAGKLEKAINPYCRGLITSARPNRVMLFYENRSETDPLVLTNLPQNGFLNNFKLYWDFHTTTNNLVPDLANAKWTWNYQTTRVNAKGLELETRDALNIYTAAQYGFNKSIPLAITNNSRYDEMANEGFEDMGYDESINKATAYTCGKRHLDFRGVNNSQIINTDQAGFNAHTGKYVMGINPGTSQLNIPVTNSIPTDFNFYFKTDTAKGPLYNEGVNIATLGVGDADPDPFQHWMGAPTNQQLVELGTTYTVGGHAGMRYSFTKFDREDCTPTNTPNVYLEIVQGYSRIRGNQYIEIKNCGNYQIDLDLYTDNNSSGATYIYLSQRFNLQIYDLDGNLVTSFQVDDNQFHVIRTLYAMLGKGVFLFTWESISQLRFEQTDGFCNNSGIYSNEGRNVQASFAIHWPTGQSTPPGYLVPKTYKTLASLSDCYVFKPMAAKDSMLNPVFSVPANKKMVFSAWIKEACGNPATGMPCTAATYANNQVNLQFNDAGNTLVTLKPSGPVIEGWQRYEGYFTAPATATQMTMNMINNSASMIYFDDIRIHPFDANMRSYVYDPVNLLLVAELDANNYATYYEYDPEGILVRKKVETKEGKKTLNETRSFRQRSVKEIQP